MDDTLQRLLDAEMRAENLARAAEEERERTIRAATAEARTLDEGFSARIPTLQQTWVSRAEERAATTIAEVERRYDERHQRLRDIAEEREDEALGAAFRILMDSKL
jgi:V/A-type H+/Na+-transporting ATPase subunit G/H